MGFKPFDLEQAKAGKPFAPRQTLSPDESRVFIGVNAKGDEVCYEMGGSLMVTKRMNLIMLPEVKKYKGILFRIKDDQECTWPDTPRHRELIRNSGYIIVKEFEVEYEE